MNDLQACMSTVKRPSTTVHTPKGVNAEMIDMVGHAPTTGARPWERVRKHTQNGYYTHAVGK